MEIAALFYSKDTAVAATKVSCTIIVCLCSKSQITVEWSVSKGGRMESETQ